MEGWGRHQEAKNAQLSIWMKFTMVPRPLGDTAGDMAGWMAMRLRVTEETGMPILLMKTMPKISGAPTPAQPGRGLSPWHIIFYLILVTAQ